MPHTEVTYHDRHSYAVQRDHRCFTIFYLFIYTTDLLDFTIVTNNVNKSINH